METKYCVAINMINYFPNCKCDVVGLFFTVDLTLYVYSLITLPQKRIQKN